VGLVDQNLIVTAYARLGDGTEAIRAGFTTIYRSLWSPALTLDHLPGGRILRDAVRHVSQTPNLYDKKTFAGVKPKLPWIGPTSFKKAAREVSGVQDELDLYRPRAAEANIQYSNTPLPLLFEDEDDSKFLGRRSVEVAPTSHLSLLTPRG